MTYVFTLHCRICGCEHTPTREDIAAGPSTYHRCPQCRPPAPQGEKSRMVG